jgi:hypothetical protein
MEHVHDGWSILVSIALCNVGTPAQGPKLRASGSGLKAPGLGLRAQSSGLGASGLGPPVPCPHSTSRAQYSHAPMGEARQGIWAMALTLFCRVLPTARAWAGRWRSVLHAQSRENRPGRGGSFRAMPGRGGNSREMPGWMVVTWAEDCEGSRCRKDLRGEVTFLPSSARCHIPAMLGEALGVAGPILFEGRWSFAASAVHFGKAVGGRGPGRSKLEPASGGVCMRDRLGGMICKGQSHWTGFGPNEG